jgi:hypothetical protein
LRAEALRKSLLAEATDTTLERLLIDHIVVSWLDAEFTRVATIQPQKYKQDARFWTQRQERADARYLAAIRELATLRGLLGHTAPAISIPEPTEDQVQESGCPPTSQSHCGVTPGRMDSPNHGEPMDR